MKTKDSFELSVMKFKAKKFRSFFTAFTLSLGIVLIISIVMGTAGVAGFVKNNFRDSVSNAPYIVFNQNLCGGYNFTYADESECLEPFKFADLQASYPEYNFSNPETYYLAQAAPDAYTLFQNETDLSSRLSNSDASMSTVVTVNQMLAQDYVYDGYSFEDIYAGKIPLIVPEAYITKGEFSPEGLTPRELFEKRSEVLKKYLGTTQKLARFESDLARPAGENAEPAEAKLYELEFIIVGYYKGTPVGDSLTSNMHYSFTIPRWALDQNAEIAEIFAKPVVEMTLIKMDSVEIRDEFMYKYFEDRRDGDWDEKMDITKYITAVYGRFFSIEQMVSVILVLGLIAGGILLFISLLFAVTTIGKIIDDSRKEIGVFRAFGALKSDVRKIYYGYALLLSSLGFVIGTGVSFLINVALSIGLGDRVFYSFAGLGNNFTEYDSGLLFVSFPVLPLGGLFLLLSVLVLLASYFPVRRASKIDPIIVMRDE